MERLVFFLQSVVARQQLTDQKLFYSWLARYVYEFFFFTIFQFAKGVYYFIHQEFYLVRLQRYLKSHN